MLVAGSITKSGAVTVWCGGLREEMKYLFKFIFSFLRSDVEAKRGVAFRHSTRNASRIRQKWGTDCLNTRFPLPTLLFAGYSVKLIYFNLLIKVNHILI